MMSSPPPKKKNQPTPHFYAFPEKVRIGDLPAAAHGNAANSLCAVTVNYDVSQTLDCPPGGLLGHLAVIRRVATTESSNLQWDVAEFEITGE